MKTAEQIAEELWHEHTGGMGIYMTYEQFVNALRANNRRYEADIAGLKHYAISLKKAAEPFCAIKNYDNDTLNGYAPETIIRIEASVREIRGLRMCAGYGQSSCGSAIDQAQNTESHK